MSSVKRLSYQNTGGRKSYAPTSISQSNVENTERRSSIYRSRNSSNGPTGHQSFFQQVTQAAGVPRDPRPLRDRSYQTKIGQDLLDYLTQHNFEMTMKHMLSQNTTKSPTQKDFNFMFQFLYRQIDPSYRFQKSIEQEVPQILKQLRYPYEKSITKSQITAVGGQNWFTFLGMLHWMMQLAQMLEGYEAGRYEEACLEAGVDVTGDRIIFEFLSSAYRDWLAMDDEADESDQERALAPHVNAMAQQFDRSNAKYLDDVAMLEAEHEKLQKEIDEIEKTTPDIATLDKHYEILKTDDVAFTQWVNTMQQKIDKYEARIKFIQEEIDKEEVELKEAEEERANLQKAVDDQGISMRDIDRMNSERERLQKGIESTAQRLDEAKRKVAEKEAETSAKLEELELLVESYNSLAYQIALIPSTAANAKGNDYELQLTLNDGPSFSASQPGSSQLGANTESDRLLADPVTGYQAHHILNLDLRGQVKTSFVNLRKEISERRSVAMERMMKDHDLLDQIKEAITDKHSEVETLGHRVRAAQEEFEKTKEITTTQKLASDTQIEKMEKELAKMRAGLTESVQLMEQREINTNIEYEQLTFHANALREELHTDIEKMLNDIIKFKVHIQKNLEDYEAFVSEELEQELAGDEVEIKEDEDDVLMG